MGSLTKWFWWAPPEMPTVVEAELVNVTTETGESEPELTLWFEQGKPLRAKLAPGLLFSRNWRV